MQEVDTNTLHIDTTTLSTQHTKAIVCDLRLLKPKTDEADTRLTLDPKFSYYLSKKIEYELPKKIPGTAVVVGTFGCMTGTYLCVSCLDDRDEDIAIIHAHIMDILREMPMDGFSMEHQNQLKQILKNYNNPEKK